MKRLSPTLRKLLQIRPPQHFLADPLPVEVDLPKGALLIDLARLQHAPSVYVPLWYQDQPFKCRDCGKIEVWTAAQQKRYCEEQLGDPNARAIRCRSCREARNEAQRKRREQQEANRAKKLAAKARKTLP